MRKAYCSGFGVEFMNINDPNKKQWLQSQIETLQDAPILTRNEKLYMLRQLADAEVEQFLHRRYPGTKRFSLRAETLIPLLSVLVDTAANMGPSVLCLVWRTEVV